MKALDAQRLCCRGILHDGIKLAYSGVGQVCHVSSGESTEATTLSPDHIVIYCLSGTVQTHIKSAHT